MKKMLAILIVCAVALASCSKNADGVAAPVTPPGDNMGNDTGNTAAPNYHGVLAVGVEGKVSGIAKIYLKNNAYTLRLDSFMVSSGPDLHVYLAKEATPIHFIDLGKLRATSGNQVYAISGQPDFAVFKYAVIHCQQYNVVFGSAELK